MASNIHGFSDLESQRRTNPSRFGDISSFELNPNGGDIRCIDIFFPFFNPKSFIFLISVIEVCVYFATLFAGSKNLTPYPLTLQKFGDGFGPLIRQGQWWRIVTPIFLHVSIWHITFNVFYQLTMGCPLEHSYGTAKMIILYFVSGVGGNLLSSVFGYCEHSVGASTAGFGLIGIQLAELALAWHLIRNHAKIILNLVVFFVIVMFMSFTPNSNIDWKGHLGGLVVGFCIGIFFNKDMENPPSWLKTGAIASVGSIVLLYVGCPIAILLFPYSC